MSLSALHKSCEDCTPYKHPILAALAGSVGTGKLAFPSTARSVLGQTPKDVQAVEFEPVVESVGFTLVDVTRADGMTLTFHKYGGSTVSNLTNFDTAGVGAYTGDRSVPNARVSNGNLIETAGYNLKIVSGQMAQAFA